MLRAAPWSAALRRRFGISQSGGKPPHSRCLRRMARARVIFIAASHAPRCCAQRSGAALESRKAAASRRTPKRLRRMARARVIFKAASHAPRCGARRSGAALESRKAAASRRTPKRRRMARGDAWDTIDRPSSQRAAARTGRRSAIQQLRPWVPITSRFSGT